MQRKTIEELRRVLGAATDSLGDCSPKDTAKQVIEKAERVKKIVIEELEQLKIRYATYSLSGVIKIRTTDDKDNEVIKSTLETLVTVAVSVNEKGIADRGMSIRIPRDQHCKVIGQSQALRRLLRAIKCEKCKAFTLTREGFDAFTLVSEKSDEGLSLIRNLYYRNDKKKHKAWLVHHGGGPYAFERKLLGMEEPKIIVTPNPPAPAEKAEETETTAQAVAGTPEDSLEAWKRSFKIAEGKEDPVGADSPAVMAKPMTSGYTTTYPKSGGAYHGDFEGYHD